MSRPARPDMPGRILDAAEHILSENGLEALDMRDLAASLGVTATAVYHYFGGKSAIVDGIRLRAVRDLDEAGTAMDDEGSPPLVRLESLMRSIFAWFTANPARARLIQGGLPPKLDAESDVMASLYVTHERARALIEAAQASGSYQRGDPDMLASIGYASLWGLFLLHDSRRVHPKYWNDPGPLLDGLIGRILDKKEIGA